MLLSARLGSLCVRRDPPRRQASFCDRIIHRVSLDDRPATDSSKERAREETVMKRSTDRILTTHTGSLPRPSDLLSMMTAAESGGGANAKEVQTRIRSAVAQTVRKQDSAGVGILN